jgi:hypothetical protein
MTRAPATAPVTDLFVRDPRVTVDVQLSRICYHHGTGADTVAKIEALDWATAAQKRYAIATHHVMTRNS